MSKCGRCGRKLRGTKSIERGFGPVCFKKQFLERAFGSGTSAPEIEPQCPGQISIYMIPGVVPEVKNDEGIDSAVETSPGSEAVCRELPYVPAAPQMPEHGNTVHKMGG